MNKKLQIILELTNEEGSLLGAILKRLGDEDVTEWLRQEKQILDFYNSTSDESCKAQIEFSYKNLCKKIENASSFDNK
jgi:ketopantoate reductase